MPPQRSSTPQSPRTPHRSIFPAGPDSYLFADAGYCQRTLARAGFEPISVRVETVILPWHLPTADLPFEAELRAGVRTGAILRAQPPERVEQIRAAVNDVAGRYAVNGGFTLPIAAQVISAQSTGG
jgi:hypothetical protein